MNRLFGIAFVLVVGGATANAAGLDWQHVQENPLAGAGKTLAIDGVHRRAYLFGGLVNGVASSGLYEQDLDDSTLTWRLVSQGETPARTGANSWFDAARGRLLVLGGTAAGFPAAAIWSWDPGTASWAQPPVREGGPAAITSSFPLTYDSRRDRLLYIDDSGPGHAARGWALDLVADTLTWSAFAESSTVGLPPNSAAAFDSLGDRACLYLSGVAGQLFMVDMASGKSFAPFVYPAGSPTPRMVIDRTRNRIVLDDPVGDFDYNPVYFIDLAQPTSYTSILDHNQPTYASRLWAVDPVRDAIEVVAVDSSAAIQSTLTTRETVAWSNRLPANRPAGGSGMASAVDPDGRWWYVYDSHRLFRVSLDYPNVSDLLEPTGNGPGAGLSAVFDSAGARILYFGGASPDVPALVLTPPMHWETIATTGPGPSNQFVVPAIDQATRRVFLIGASSFSRLDLSQDPAVWTDLGSLSLLMFEGCAGYDRQLDRIIGVNAYQGFAVSLSGGPPYAATTVGLGPFARGGIMATFDTRRNRILFHGGFHNFSNTGMYRPDNTMSWDGVALTDLLASHPVPPPADGYGALTYDFRRDQLLLLNGERYQQTGGGYPSYAPVYAMWSLFLGGTVPTRLAFADATVEGQSIRVRFSGERAEGAVNVERSSGASWGEVGAARELEPGLYEFVDGTVQAGGTYRYRASYRSEGEDRITEVSTPITMPGASAKLLFRARGGTVGHGWPADFDVLSSTTGAAALELIDISGRVVARRTFETSSESGITVSLTPDHPVAGLYFVRLTSKLGTMTAKIIRL